MAGTNEEKRALVIFAREPKIGKVKTRLQKDLSPATVLQLYQAFVKDVLGVARKVECHQRIIYYTGSNSSTPFLSQFYDDFSFRRQRGRDLGQRMLAAFQYCQKQGFAKTVIVGTDCLTMTPGDMNRAYKKLDQHDCVLGPNRDGGYYLIGLRQPQKRLFAHVKWSTDRVLPTTLKRIKQLRKQVFLLKEKDDIDTIVSLRRYAKFIDNKKRKFSDFVIMNIIEKGPRVPVPQKPEIR